MMILWGEIASEIKFPKLADGRRTSVGEYQLFLEKTHPRSLLLDFLFQSVNHFYFVFWSICWSHISIQVKHPTALYGVGFMIYTAQLVAPPEFKKVIEVIVEVEFHIKLPSKTGGTPKELVTPVAAYHLPIGIVEEA